jgi:hypothetical protein
MINIHHERKSTTNELTVSELRGLLRQKGHIYVPVLVKDDVLSIRVNKQDMLAEFNDRIPTDLSGLYIVGKGKNYHSLEVAS